jgi:hypothetical protein
VVKHRPILRCFEYNAGASALRGCPHPPRVRRPEHIASVEEFNGLSRNAGSLIVLTRDLARWRRVLIDDFAVRLTPYRRINASPDSVRRGREIRLRETHFMEISSGES